MTISPDARRTSAGNPNTQSELDGPRLGVVLVNYKRPDDTIECLESVLRGTVAARVIVVDNQSGDGSLERISAWAAGTYSPTPASADMSGFTNPPIAKPIPFARLTATEAASCDPSALLTLVDAGSNHGFAAGNNIGIQHLMRDQNIEFVWLLNNDTVVEPEAAKALLARLDATPRVGMCGTVVRYYWHPDKVQALNGHRFNILWGTSKGIGANQPAALAYNPAQVAAETDFVLGASLAVSRRFIETVGMMSEYYFLYFEEIDWSTRNAGRFATAFAHGSIVYHKEGGSIGSSGIAGSRSAMSDYWHTRSRLRYFRRHRPLLLPWHWMLTLGVALRRLLRRQPIKAAATIRALLGIDY